MSEGPKEAEWIRIQSKTFKNWCNTHLKHRMMSINDLRTDLTTGLPLIALVEVISGGKLVNNGKYNKNPKVRTQMMENAGFALQFLKNEGLKLVNIGNEDIVDSNHKLILGVIWTIILRYQINISEGKSARSELLAWVRRKIPEKNIINFDHDWNDGTALCHLINALKSGLFPDLKSLDPENKLDNATRGTQTAEREMGISAILAPEDMVNPEIDELSVMTYIALFKEWEDKQASLKDTFDASKSSVYGPGVEGGKEAVVRKPVPFTIESKNAFNDRLTRGGETFRIQVTGPKGDVPATVTDKGDGLYDVVYTPNQPGAHTVVVEHKSIPVAQSPYQVDIDAGVDASKTTVSGPGVTPSGVAKDHPTHFTIQSVDSDGNKVSSGGAPFKALLAGPSGEQEIPLKDNGDGTYTGNYEASALGPHKVHVNLEDKAVAQSPYHVQVKELSDPTKTKVSGPGVEPSIPEGVPTHILIEAVSPKGQPIQTGGDHFTVKVKGPNGEQDAKVSDNGDGTYTAEYTPEGKGATTVEVHNHGPEGAQHVAKSPYHVNVREPADRSKTQVSGPGIKSGRPQGVPTHVDIEARDKDGKPIGQGGDQFAVSVKGPNGEVPATLKDNGDGHYRADYTPEDLGDHTVEIKLKDQTGEHGHVDKSPYHVNVRPAADHSKSKVSGPGIKSGRPQGVSTHVDIEAKDKDGNPVTQGGDDFVVVVKGPNGDVPAKVTDNGDGTHRAEYTPTDLGDHTVEVKLHENHVDQSPYHVNVRPAADHSKTKVSGPGIKDGVPEKVETYINIKAIDANGEPVTQGGDDFVVTVEGPSGAVPAKVQDNGDGTHKATYTAQETGPHTVHVKLQDKDVAQSPYKINVRERGDASKSTAEGPGLVQPVQNVPTHFTVTAKDKEGQAIPVGGDKVTASIKGPNGESVPVDVKDNEDGTYLATYTPDFVGDAHVEVLMNGDHVADSPYHVFVDEEADNDASGLENFQFVIRAKRKDGQPKPKGGDRFAVKIFPADKEAEPLEDVKFRDLGDGRYKVVYNLPGSGEYNVHITLNGKHITGSPWKQSC
ncbi:hypothetical protein PROFUN_04164 [Planoprotostelium fungivorum]|uniref:Calponin-homology (CH) domain-containing protein n=1 Tax=Planoprotostelium fungivorum TaxID=1890364 RepID=A0A2P6NVT1_9EUKA|nr:hypothetical protein PROFUN_04164 [Planoprotostelium fungivorum]